MPLIRRRSAAGTPRRGRRAAPAVDRTYADPRLAAPEGSPLGELGGCMRESEVILGMYEAAERSAHHPGFPRRRDWTRDFDTFAPAFAPAGEAEAAADLFAVLDGSVTEFPWMYLDGRDPTAPFRTWSTRVGA